jgi:hypothetical protein
VAARLGADGRGCIQVCTPYEDPEITDGMLSVRIEIDWTENGQERSLPLRFAICQMGV